jgi:diguanylate cyclase (GGDEF)-like protein
MRTTLARCRVAGVAVATATAAVRGGTVYPTATAAFALVIAWVIAALTWMDTRKERHPQDRVILFTGVGDALLVTLWVAAGSVDVALVGLVVLGAAVNAVLLKGRWLGLVGLLRCAGVASAYWATHDLSRLSIAQYVVAVTADTMVSLLVARLAGEERRHGREQAEADRHAAALRDDLRRHRAVHEATRALTSFDGLDDALARICHAAGQVFDASFATILLVAGDKREVRGGWNLPELDPEYLRTIGTKVLRDLMPSGRAFTTGEVIIVADVTVDPDYDPRVRAVASTVGWRSCLSFPLLSEGKVAGALNIYYREARSVDPDLRMVGELLAAEAVGAVRLAVALDELRLQAITDPLTRLFNFRQARHRLAGLLADRERRGRQLTVLFMDLDNLKLINDREGHQRGDAVLLAVAELLRNTLRGVDIAARAGGDEFVAILPETDPAAAALIAERIRAGVAALGDDCPKTTVSIGHATAPDAGSTVDEVIRAADIAMYIAKRAGKNRVAGFGDELTGDLLLGEEPVMVMHLEELAELVGTAHRAS